MPTSSTRRCAARYSSGTSIRSTSSRVALPVANASNDVLIRLFPSPPVVSFRYRAAGSGPPDDAAVISQFRGALRASRGGTA